ncbi:hypothetical protein J6Q66_04845 [bacterium]|nr:hypothetical protein [bacterium]
MVEIANMQCPMCGEYINKYSEVCSFCGEKLIKDEPQNEANLETNEENINNEERIETNKISKKFLCQIILSVICILIFIASFFIGAVKFKKEKTNITKDMSIEKTVVETPPVNNIDNAKQLYKEKKYEEAAQIFQNEIDLNNNSVAIYYMGEIYNDQGFLGIAIDYYKLAINTKKDFLEPHKRLSEIYFYKQNYDLAKQYGESALLIKNNNLELLKHMAFVYNALGDETKFRDIVKKVAQIDTKDTSSNLYMGNYHYSKDEFKEAIPYYKNVLKNTFDVDAAYSLIVCYVKNEYYSLAIEVVDKIIDKYPYDYHAKEIKNNLLFLKYDYEYRKNLNKN